jgi:predicted protein tyrosine phosphatase
MPKRKLLFICGRNVDRSPTAEAMFSTVEGFEAKSAGVFVGATNPLTKDLIQWADEIYCMEYIHQQAILKMMPSSWKKVECLEIPDVYYRDQPELRQLIVEKMKLFLVS